MQQKIKKFIENKTNFLAGIILGIMFLLMLASSAGDSLTRDELAHIVSGYSYLTQQDYRLNPEHPPLIKDLAALPLLFFKPAFPVNDNAWTNEVNAQWSLGDTFLFKTPGNDADKIIFWARFPMFIVAILFGFYLFRFTKELAGNKFALLALVLFAFSPNIIAHSRLVTTDLGIAFFALVSFYYFWKFIEKPTLKNIFIAGIVFGLAHLAKFSSFLLFPAFGLMIIMASFRPDGAMSDGKKSPVNFLRSLPVKKFFVYLKGCIVITVLAYLLVGAAYSFHIKNMPLSVQHRLIDDSIGQESYKPIKDVLHKMADNSVLRPYSQYALGFFMVYAHSSAGHTTYFLGEMGRNWRDYYLVAYLIKEPIPSQLLFYLSAALVILSLRARQQRGEACLSGRQAIPWNKACVRWMRLFRHRAGLLTTARTAILNLLQWTGKYYLELGMILFILLLFAMGTNSKLQLGIRYILPVFPFLYILIAIVLKKFRQNWKNEYFVRYFPAAIIFLAFWLALEAFYFFPSYIAYYNELIGGPKNGYKYLVDSNTDWGQDLKRLAEFADKNKIDKIKLDYFGGADPKYYLGDKFVAWGFDKGPATGWVAISASALQWNRGIPEDKKIKPAELNYHWLDKYTPVAQIGYSIFVYNIK